MYKENIRTCGSQKEAQTSMAVRFKMQMNDVIDVAYTKESEGKRAKYKRFYIFGTTKAMKTRLGDCWHNKDGSSSIRILAMATRHPADILLTALHEVSHHIDFVNRKASGHDATFYAVYKQLLCAALNMGIITMNDVRASENHEHHSRCIRKVVQMLGDYEPDLVDYKNDVAIISVYNSYAIKDQLKERGYHWNGVDRAWTKEIPLTDVNSEKEYLRRNGLNDANIHVSTNSGVITRYRKVAKLYRVPYEKKEMVKALGYTFVKEGQKSHHWEKQIEGDTIPPEEMKKLKEEMPDIYWQIF